MPYSLEVRRSIVRKNHARKTSSIDGQNRPPVYLENNLWHRPVLLWLSAYGLQRQQYDVVHVIRIRAVG